MYFPSSMSCFLVLCSITDQCGHRAISLKLFEIVDDLGLSDEMRSINVETHTTGEILSTLRSPSQHLIYHFGSQTECSTIMEMLPDLDQVEIPTYTRVVTSVADCQYSAGFLLVPDTQPGYVRLQLVMQGHLVTIHIDDTFICPRLYVRGCRWFQD